MTTELLNEKATEVIKTVMVDTLQTDDSVEILTVDGDRHFGSLQSVTDTSIDINVDLPGIAWCDTVSVEWGAIDSITVEAPSNRIATANRTINTLML